MIGLQAEKYIILFGMLIATLVCGALPWLLVKKTNNANDQVNSARWRKALSLMNCFSGGVFVAACLLDLVPDVEEAIKNVLDEIKATYNVDVDYPVAQFIIVAGFFLVLFIEQLVLECRGDALLHGHSHLPTTVSAADRRSLMDEGPESNETNNTPDDSNIGEDVEDLILNNPEGHTHQDDHALEHSSLRSILLLIALSFHSLFEGLAIGLQETAGQLFSIFIAVIVHKGIMAFSLGLSLAQAKLSLKNFLYSVTIFSVASPIGMAIGIALTGMEQSLARDICNGILQGMAGGTFLYITFFEVLPHELKSPHYRMLRFLAVLVGYLCICALLLVAG